MKSVNEHLNKLNENNEVSQDNLLAVQKELPALVKLIQKQLGFSPKLVVTIENSRQGNRINLSSNDLTSELGKTLVKNMFSEIKIEFWGGVLSSTENKIWFNPKVQYTHPGGGSNGTDFVWDSLWFDLDTNKWIEGRKIF